MNDGRVATSTSINDTQEGKKGKKKQYCFSPLVDESPTDLKETCAEWWTSHLQIRRRPVLSGGRVTYRSEGDLC